MKRGAPTTRSKPGEVAVWVLSAVFGAAAAATFAAVLRGLEPWPAPFHLTWWMLAPLYVLAEAVVLHVQLRRETYSISLNEIPLVLGLFFAAPGDLFVAHLVGAVVALGLLRRQRPIRMAFNVSHFLVETSVAVLLFRSIATPADPMGATTWLAALSAAFVVDVFAGAAVHTAISLADRQSGGFPRLLGLGSLASLGNASIALLGAALLWFRPSLGFLLIVPAALVVLAYRAYHAQRRNRDALEVLYESARSLQGQLGVDAVVGAVLEQARRALGGDFAELVLASDGGEGWAVRAAVGPGEARRGPERVALGREHPAWRAVAQARAAVIVRGGEDTVVRAYLDRHGITRAVAAPLFREGEVTGVLVAGNSMGELGEYGRHDLRLFEMLAQHAAVSLEKGTLIDDLQRHAEENEYQARHDALTGLHNRYAFVQSVDAALASRPAEGLAAVLLLDLDGFKEINDALGHDTGDVVLIEAAARLASSLDDGSLVARLGGDEFAIFLSDVDSMADVNERAYAVLAELRRPFEIDDLSLEVGASIGAALYPHHGSRAQTLVQRADVAMYVAKEQHRGLEIYSPANDRYSPGRLKLVGELRQAIGGGELEVHYQPKLQLMTGEVKGVEALVRWNHRRNGFVPPDEFVALAEHSGLIGRLTAYVLDRSLEQARRWIERGLDDFHVSVNMSARHLLDASLPGDVGEMLERWSVPPRCLRLEITESHIMADPPRAISVLARLNEMGVGLAIDDFGTGYSSLAYLKRVPAGEIKIDRSFVLGMTSDDSDALIVRSVIDLARNLGMDVVAEGIETREVYNRLVTMGCQLGQGYYISRPLPADRLTEWMSERRPRGAAAGAGVVQFPLRRAAD